MDIIKFHFYYGFMAKLCKLKMATWEWYRSNEARLAYRSIVGDK